MNKEELQKMAREAGCPTWFGVVPMEFVENFANAILERAAVECEQEYYSDAGKELAEAVRALKGK